MNFFDWFEDVLEKLEKRSVSFKKVIDYLETQKDPIIILETGCLRKPDNFSGEGQSTLIFDKYIQHRNDGSRVYSVDINPTNVETCRSIVSKNVHIEVDDSVKFISNMDRYLNANEKISLLYLDSFDVNFLYPFESSAHHLKELTASMPYINKNTLLVVDDAPLSMQGYRDENNNFKLIKNTTIGGKGYLIHEYAQSIGAEFFFSHYQLAYKNLTKQI